MNAQRYAGAAWPFVLIVLTGIYGYWAVQRELVSSRPSIPGKLGVPDPVSAAGIRSLHSRLWQDPLSTAYDDWKSLPDTERAQRLMSFSDSDVLTNAVQIAATSSRESEPTAGFDNGSPKEEQLTPDEIRHEVRLSRHAADMRKVFRSLVDATKTKCMPVLLPGGPYAEDNEKRMRIRYAVVTALAESGYSLKYSTRMSYVVVRIHVRVLRGWQECEIVVPVKLYRLDDSSHQVLVLWVNESELELRPLLGLHRILNAMFSDVTKRENLDVSILGPSSSDTLDAMSAEIVAIHDTFFPRVIHEANTFNFKPRETAIEEAFDKIERQASIVKAACDRRIRQSGLIGEKADVIANTRSYGYIRKLTKEIKQAVGDDSDATAVEIRQSADEIDALVGKIERKADDLAEAAYKEIQEAASSIANEIGGTTNTRAGKSFETEAKFLSDIWQTVGDINKKAEEINGVEAEQQKDRAKFIERAANKIELAGASAVIQRATAIIKQRAKAVEDGMEKTIDLAEIAQQVDRIRVAQVYELTKQAADRIAEIAANNIQDDANLEQTVNRIKALTTEAYEIIKQLGGNVSWNESSNHWYATAHSEKHAKRTEGFMPLLSPLEYGGDIAQLFSPHATMDDIEFSQNNVVRLHRVIGTDSQLAKALFQELELRGAVPGKIVLITEHDTAYGHAFPATLESVLPVDFESQIPRIFDDNKCFECHGQDDEDRKTDWRLDQPASALAVLNKPDKSQESTLIRKLTGREKDPDHSIDSLQLAQLKRWIDQGAEYERTSKFVSFKILRGIDGGLPDDKSDGTSRAQGSRKKSSPTELPEIVERQPMGRTQYDYLTRLRHRIRETGHVDAIGVVGSDVYDKLLVLRALKPHFPDCVFFTTDLDAIYIHPDERQHTRNLMIASHFDLSLDDQLQESTAPFRDSYQTSTFLATRLAIHHDDPGFRDAEKKWATVVDHWFGDEGNKDKSGAKTDKDEIEIDPVLHVVGSTSTHPLTRFNEGTIERRLHPNAPHVTGSWHYFFAGGLTLVAVGLVWGLFHRDGFRNSKLLNHKGDIPGHVVNLGLIILLGIGCVLVLWSCYRGFRGNEASDFLAGYSTWPRKILCSVTGIFSVLSVVYVREQFYVRLEEVKKRYHDFFQNEHIAKIALLALVIGFTGTVLVYEFDLWGFWIPTFATALGLAAAWWCYAKLASQGPDPASGNLILSRDLAPALRYGLISVIAVAALGFIGDRLLEVQHFGWHPATTSRDPYSRFGDWFATSYAFGAVALLLSTLLYSHLWCREFARKAKEQFDKNNGQAGSGAHGTADDPEVAEQPAPMDSKLSQPRENKVGKAAAPAEGDRKQNWKNEHDLLWTIGKLSSASGIQAPVLMGLLFVLMMAYHPRFSPTPMPLSLVVMTTIALIVFMVSALSLRRHFHNVRNKTLSDLQRDLENTIETTELEDTSETTEAKVASQNEAQSRQKKRPELAFLTTQKEKLEAISEGVFRPWNQSPIGWILGGGTALALVDLWAGWWVIGL